MIRIPEISAFPRNNVCPGVPLSGAFLGVYARGEAVTLTLALFTGPIQRFHDRDYVLTVDDERVITPDIWQTSAYKVGNFLISVHQPLTNKICTVRPCTTHPRSPLFF